MSDYGIKISKPGVDVTKAEDSELIYTSTLFGLKVYQTGLVDVTIPASSADFSVHYTDVTHDLGYAPAFFAFVEDGNGDMHAINSAFTDEMQEGGAFLDAFAWSDTSKLRLSMTIVSGPATPITRTFRYYIFLEPTV